MADELPPTSTPEPVVYDIKVEGLAPKVIESLVAEAKDLGLTQDQAMKLATKRAGLISEHEKNNKAKIEGWKNELTSDKELGGANFNTTIESRDRAIAKLIEKNPAMKDTLSKVEVIDNPLVVRLLNEIGKMSQNDTRKTGTPATPKMSMNERLIKNYESTKG